MSQPGAKTPVSIVNEYFITKDIVPAYIIEGSKIGGHENLFVCQVVAGPHSAFGEGSSKQKAKHIAAQRLLDIILKNDDFNQSDLQDALQVVSSPQDNVISFNAVGELATYCEEKSHPYPVYDNIQESGPPHARLFGVKCSVSNISELGSSRTKKQAKHQAAYAMLVRLKSLCGDEHNAVVRIEPKKNHHQDEEKSDMFKEKDEKATKCYQLHSKTSRTNEAVVYIADQYRAYSLLVEKSATLCALVEQGYFDETQSNAKVCLEQISQELNVKLQFTPLSNGCNSIWVVRFHVTPLFTKAGDTEKEAAAKALHSFIQLAM